MAEVPLKSRPANVRYSEKEVRKYLSWLAYQMKARDQSVFMIENLQPDWLPTPWQRASYMILSRLVSTFVISLLIGVFIGVLSWQLDWGLNASLYEQFSVPVWDSLVEEVLLSVFVTCWIGLILGVTALIVDLFIEPNFNQPWKMSAVITGYVLFPLIMVGLTATYLPFILELGVFERLVPDQGFVVKYALVPVNIGGLSAPWPRICVTGFLIAVLLGGVEGIRRRDRTIKKDISSVDTLKWSWADTRHALVGAAIGLVVDFVIQDFLYTPILCFTFGLFGGAMPGLRTMKTRPNQGITLSIRNAFLVSLGCVIIAAFSWVYFYFMVWPGVAEINGIGVDSSLGYSEKGLSFTLDFVQFYLFFVMFLALFKYGLLDVVYHYTLRWLLYRKKYLPLRLVPLLEYAATELNFLQKVGGGYIFIHRYLLEHLAGLEAARLSKESDAGRAG